MVLEQFFCSFIFLPVHPYFYPSIFVFTHPNDGSLHKAMVTHLPCWVCKWHPLPRPNMTLTNFGLHLFVALIGISWDDRWSISVQEMGRRQQRQVGVQLYIIKTASSVGLTCYESQTSCSKLNNYLVTCQSYP